MKAFYLTGIVLLFTFITGNAQSFRYDTVPNPNKGQEKQLYRIEEPAAQQTNPVSDTNQESPKTSGFDKTKLVFGGSIGMVFGDYTAISVSPQVGYAFNKYFTAGAGIAYNYYSYDYVNSPDATYNYLGLNVFGRVNPIPYITLQVQPEAYYAWGNRISSQIVPCLLVGGGVTIPAGRGGINMMLFYDVVQYKSDGYKLSPYGDQIFYSVGYVFNF